MWYDTYELFICGYCTCDMSGCSGWQYSPDVITDPIFNDDDDPLYMLIDGHVVPRP